MLINRFPQGKGKIFSNKWKLFKVYTTSINWVAQNEGWHRIHLYGKCGNGANGTNEIRSSGGSGGGSGGYASFIFYFDSKIVYPITITNSITSFSDFVSVTAGENGVGIGSGTQPGGQGGIAQLTTDLSLTKLMYEISISNGYKGGEGGRPGLAYNDPDGAGTDGANGGASKGDKAVGLPVFAGGNGGGGARLPSSLYTADPYTHIYKAGSAGWGESGYYTNGGNAMSYPVFDINKPLLFGGGSGGGGGSTSTAYGAGSLGSAACVIIEQEAVS